MDRVWVTSAAFAAREGFLPWRTRFEPGTVKQAVAVHGSTLLHLLAAFVAITAVLYDRGLLDAQPLIDENLIAVVVGYYVWSLIDGVPGLQLAETLNWEKPPPTSRTL
jgi:hypothetical protein